MRRTAEDGARAVVDEHEIGDIHRQGHAGAEWVPGLEAGVIAELLGRLDGRFRSALRPAFGDEGRQLRIGSRQFLGQRMIGRDRGKGGAEDGVRPGREDRQRLGSSLDLEANLRALGSADPILLHEPDLLRPALEGGQRLQQLLGIVGDLEEPLRELALLHRRAGAPALAVDHLLIGEHGLVDLIPADVCFLAMVAMFS